MVGVASKAVKVCRFVRLPRVFCNFDTSLVLPVSDQVAQQLLDRTHRATRLFVSY